MTTLEGKVALFRAQKLEKLRNWKRIVSQADDWRDNGLTLPMVIALDFPQETELLAEVLNNSRDLELVDADTGSTALHFAAQAHSTECVEALLSAGADPNARDKNGNGPLFRAMVSQPVPLELLSALVRQGSNPKLKNLSGVSALDFAKKMAQSANQKRIEVLLAG